MTDPIAALAAAWSDLNLAGRHAASGPRDYVYASRRKRCVREMALDLLQPGDEEPPDADALERMARGREREAAIVARLLQLGPRCSPTFEVVEGQRRFEIRDRDGLLLIVGRIDGMLRFASTNGGPLARLVFEVKSGQLYSRVQQLSDLDRSPWTRHALDQLLSYLYDRSLPQGLFIVDRPALPLFLPVNLEDHLERTEGFLRDARAAVDARNGAPLPEFTEDRSCCRICCHYGRSCSPPLDFGAGTKLISDPHIVELAEIHTKTEEAHRQYERAHKELAASLRGVERAVAGPFAISGKWARQTTCKPPAEVEAQVEALLAPHRKTEEKGKYSLAVERVIREEEGNGKL